MDRRLAVTLGLASALGASVALATGPLPPFSFVDEDGDRTISRSEARSEQALHSVFDELDSNRDGQLTRLEYLGAERRRARGSSPTALDTSLGTDRLLTGNVLP